MLDTLKGYFAQLTGGRESKKTTPTGALSRWDPREQGRDTKGTRVDGETVRLSSELVVHILAMAFGSELVFWNPTTWIPRPFFKRVSDPAAPEHNPTPDGENKIELRYVFARRNRKCLHHQKGPSLRDIIESRDPGGFRYPLMRKIFPIFSRAHRTDRTEGACSFDIKFTRLWSQAVQKEYHELVREHYEQDGFKGCSFACRTRCCHVMERAEFLLTRLSLKMSAPGADDQCLSLESVLP